MKKLFILLIVFTLISCTNDSNESDTQDNILLKKVTETYQGGSKIAEFFYENNKLIKIKNTDTFGSIYVEYEYYTYQGDKIIKKEIRDVNNNFTGDYSLFNYTNDKLTQVKIYENNQLYEIENYNHISNSLITGTDNIGPFSLYFDANFNMIKKEYSTSDYSINTFDNYNNPLKNIEGYKEIHFSEFVGAFLNNIKTQSDIFNGQISDQIVISYQQYNSQNYPVLASINHNGGGTNGGGTIQFFYE